jgi:GTP-binding protein
LFIDEADIWVKGGDGGNGCIAFRREKFVPMGGPDGGDGGDGGSVICRADNSVNTLLHLTGKHHWRAQGGVPGMGAKCSGKKGQDVIILLPPGTVIRDAEHGTLLKDLTKAGDEVVIARGGRGGRGNQHFATPTNQAPRIATPGQKGQERSLHLELKLIADVGLLGQPNAGKSTLLRHVSRARPKVADYPFTTLEPMLGIVELSDERRYVMADIPGLIEGAHAGVGLGTEFLRHVERTTLLVHIVDMLPSSGDPAENYRVINAELAQHSAVLARKPQVVVANKMDLTGADEACRVFAKAIGKRVHRISAATGEGLKELNEAIWKKLHPAKRKRS